MAVRKLRPTTPSQRHMVVNDYSELTPNSTPEKTLMAAQTRSGGRNHTGKMTMRYMGGGHKQSYRLIDFKRDKFDIPGTVKSIEYDPNRTAHIALIVYADGEKRYIIAPSGIKEGQKIVSGKTATAMARSAGSYAQLTNRDGKYAVIKLPSGETRLILSTCLATIGSISNADHINQTYGKAGKKRWAGRRPRTRPVAMNPVDHPMGGGEGRASGGHPRSRKGLLSKGFKTRSKKKASSKFIIERRKK
jgi:large subunit ribosomal protein L2